MKSYSKFHFSSKLLLTGLHLFENNISKKIILNLDKNYVKKLTFIGNNKIENCKEISMSKLDNNILFFSDKLISFNDCELFLQNDDCDIDLILNNTDFSIHGRNEKNISINLKKSKVSTEILGGDEIIINSSNSIIDIKELVSNRVKIDILETDLEIDKLIIRDSFKINSNDNNKVLIPYIKCNDFTINGNNNDKIKLAFIDILDNSYLNLKNYKQDIKFHFCLLLGINIFLKKENAFRKILFFDRAGFSFCPTVIIDSEEEMPTDYKIKKSIMTKKLYTILLLIASIICFNISRADDYVFSDISELKSLKKSILLTK